MTWQPIETAPESTWVLLHNKHGHQLGFLRASDGKWYIDAIHEGHRSQPTHWMPLPEPPEPLSLARTAEVE